MTKFAARLPPSRHPSEAHRWGDLPQKFRF